MGGDLARLQRETGDERPFVGGTELGKLAKDYGYIKDAGRISLSDLAAIVLGRYLAKDDTVRLSDRWSQKQLTEEQTEYAAMDAWTGLQISRGIHSSHRPAPVTETTSSGVTISLLQNDGKTTIATGILQAALATSRSADFGKVYNGVNLTKTRALIRVDSVLCPAALASEYRNKPSLSSFGTPPFTLVVKRHWLRTAPDCDQPSLGTARMEAATEMQPLPASTSEPGSIGMVPDPTCSSTSGSSELRAHPPVSASEEALLEVNEDSEEDDSHDTLQFTADGERGMGSSAESLVREAVLDEDSMSMGREALSNDSVNAEVSRQKKIQPAFTKKLLSRVLMDPWHAFNRIRVPKRHGLRRFFARSMRDAVMVPDKQDQAAISAYLESEESSWEEMLQMRPQWLWERCKRTIPGPDELYDALKTVFNTYGPLKDAKTGEPLFNASAWQDVKHIMALVKIGLLSDPAGISLYFRKGTDSQSNLPLYRCSRGTNSVEGGVHQNIRRRLPISGVSPRHAATRLKDYILMHNLAVSSEFAVIFAMGLPPHPADHGF